MVFNKEVAWKITEIVVVPVTLSIASTLLTLWIASSMLLYDKANQAFFNRYKTLIEVNDRMYSNGQLDHIFKAVGISEAELTEIDKPRLFYSLQSLLIYAMYNQTVADHGNRLREPFLKTSHYYEMVKAPEFECIWWVVKPFFGRSNTKTRVEATMPADEKRMEAECKTKKEEKEKERKRRLEEATASAASPASVAEK